MNGKMHAVVGAGVGLAVSQSMGSNLEETVLLIITGTVSSLIPDLDTAGKLANKISFPHQLMQNMLRLFGSFIIIYSWMMAHDFEKVIGIATGIFLFLLAPKFSQKVMLFISGVALIGIGMSVETIWLSMLGGYTAIATLLPHRSYTHSLLGLIAFSLIAFYANNELAVKGIFWTGFWGYCSHLICDMRILPGNNRGIKLLLPISRHEF